MKLPISCNLVSSARRASWFVGPGGGAPATSSLLPVYAEYPSRRARRAGRGERARPKLASGGARVVCGVTLAQELRGCESVYVAAGGNVTSASRWTRGRDGQSGRWICKPPRTCCVPGSASPRFGPDAWPEGHVDDGIHVSHVARNATRRVNVNGLLTITATAGPSPFLFAPPSLPVAHTAQLSGIGASVDTNLTDLWSIWTSSTLLRRNNLPFL